MIKECSSKARVVMVELSEAIAIIPLVTAATLRIVAKFSSDVTESFSAASLSVGSAPSGIGGLTAGSSAGRIPPREDD